MKLIHSSLNCTKGFLALTHETEENKILEPFFLEKNMGKEIRTGRHTNRFKSRRLKINRKIKPAKIMGGYLVGVLPHIQSVTFSLKCSHSVLCECRQTWLEFVPHKSVWKKGINHHNHRLVGSFSLKALAVSKARFWLRVDLS